MKAEVRYRIFSRAELPLSMRAEYSFDQAYELVCLWNDGHEPEHMAWMVRTDYAD